MIKKEVLQHFMTQPRMYLPDDSFYCIISFIHGLSINDDFLHKELDGWIDKKYNTPENFSLQGKVEYMVFGSPLVRRPTKSEDNKLRQKIFSILIDFISVE